MKDEASFERQGNRFELYCLNTSQSQAMHHSHCRSSTKSKSHAVGGTGHRIIGIA